MLTEIFVRDRNIYKHYSVKDIEKLITELKPQIVVVEYNTFSNSEEAVKELEQMCSNGCRSIDILIIDGCGLTKCQCSTERYCICGYAIVDDLLTQKCLDKYKIHVYEFVNATRIRPM